MPMPVFRRALLAAVLVSPAIVSLTGCDASESVPNPAAGTSLTVTPSLGLVRNAAIVVRNAAGTQVGTGMTDNNGVASLRAQGSGPFVVEVLGGGSAQYFDENLGAFVNFPAGQSIHALVPTGVTNVGVTGLTEVAHALWNANGVPLTNTNANAANDAIRAAMASALPSLITPPNPLGAAPTPNSLTASAADLYAAILAGLADAGAGSTGLPPALAVIDQLRRDVQDGDIDGNDGTSAFTTLYNATGFATQFQNFIDTRRTSWGNAAQQATTFNLVALVEPSWNSGGGGGGGTCTAPAASTFFATRAGNYTMGVNGSTVNGALEPQFYSHLDYTVVVDAAGTISVAGNSTTYTFSASEIDLIELCPHEGNVIYTDTTSGYKAIFQDDITGQSQMLRIYQPVLNGDTATLDTTRAHGTPPAITGFSPASGPVGTTVTINGSGFGTDPSHLTVRFSNNVTALVTSASGTQLVVTVPAGAVDGPVSVTNILTQAASTSTGSFDVTAAGGGGDTANIVASNGTPAAANATVNTTDVVAEFTSPTTTTVTRVAVNGSGAHPVNVYYETNSGIVRAVQYRIDGSTLATCSTTACNGTLISLDTGTITFSNQVVAHSASGSSATLNGTIHFTAPTPPVSSGWTERASPSGFVQGGLAWGNGTFVSAGFGKSILTSTDGVSWTSRSFADNNWYNANDVIWDGSQFVLVGDSTSYTTVAPVIATSPDGVTWTRRDWGTLGETQIAGVAAGGGTLTAVGMNGNIRSSSDGGVTWTSEATRGEYFNAVASNGTTRVIVGRDSSYAGVILVNSGSGWTVAFNATGFCGKDVTWTGTQFVAVGGTGCGAGSAVVMVSTDGTSWTKYDTNIAPANFPLNKVAWIGNKLYATADNLQTSGVIVSSTDGATWTQEVAFSATGQAVLNGIASNGTVIVTVGGVKSVTKP